MYGIVEPMDVIEIRMARQPHEYANTSAHPELKSVKLPLIFRGIVSETRHDELMGQDGKPRRTVSIMGHDWGKFLQIIQIKFVKGNPISLDYLSGMFQQHFGIQYAILPAPDIISQLTLGFVNSFLKKYDCPNIIVPFDVDVSGADRTDMVMPQGPGAFPTGTLWEYYHTFGDLGPFYEMFVDDGEDKPTLVYRKPQFLTASGETVYTTKPEIIKIDPVTVQRINASRTDSNVANWFWVDLYRNSLITGPTAMWNQLSDNAYSAIIDTPNTSPTLYGIKTMEVRSNHGALYQGSKKEQGSQDEMAFRAYAARKIEQLRNANKDNVLFESGSIVMAGNEKVKVGRQLEIKRGRNVNQYYVQSVIHSFQPFRAFTTSVQFIRGTGFINRSTNDAQGIKNPYLEDVGRGPYEGV